jgi:hypothetical protein
LVGHLVTAFSGMASVVTRISARRSVYRHFRDAAFIYARIIKRGSFAMNDEINACKLVSDEFTAPAAADHAISTPNSVDTDGEQYTRHVISNYYGKVLKFSKDAQCI